MHEIIWIHTTSYTLSKISHHAVTFTHTLLMSSHPAYLSLHPLSLIYYLQCIDYSTSATCVVSNPLHIWHHRKSMWHHNQSLWHRKTVLMTSLPHNSWSHTHCILHDIHSTCHITATVTMTNTYYVFDIILRVYDITHSEWMTTQWLYLTWCSMFLYNQTHLIVLHIELSLTSF